ncbi:sigma-54 dependent transcriptional regulator [Simiduia litorea]|uniref:sigma-54-dependent transcriptional regulator n=1 Tax=Simiduia litorea TaxID=1435348 RepID=UPI0036F3CB1C
MNNTCILVVDDDQDILTAARLLLKRQVDKVITTDRPAQIPDLLAAHRFDAILLDMNFSPGESDGKQGFIWLKKILARDPHAVVIMITAHGDINTAVQAVKEGATDFIAKPWQNEKVIATLSAAVRLHQSLSEADHYKQSHRALVQAQQTSDHMLGQSSGMKQLRSLIARVAPTDANVLILGENGTGKELVARALHQQSLRAQQVFMAVDLGAVSENLFESELFGHKKGAFTGAHTDRIGRLVAAQGGTLFLDEIGNLPLPLQAKLLTVLEKRQVTPVGGNTPVAIDVRVISATNLSHSDLANEAKFRQDLFFRLNTVEIKVLPLRQRAEDISLIADHYAQLYARKYRKHNRQLSDQANALARQHPWPGNVRALRHAIERAVILAEGQHLEAADLQLTEASHLPANEPPAAGETPALPEEEDLDLERMEQTLVQKALSKHHYNISQAAKALGLTRAALYRRMEKYGL